MILTQGFSAKGAWALPHVHGTQNLRWAQGSDLSFHKGHQQTLMHITRVEAGRELLLWTLPHPEFLAETEFPGALVLGGGACGR